MSSSSAFHHQRRGPSSPASSRSKPLSCVACRQRKIKCDRTNPCLACQQAQIKCVTPNRVKRARKTALGARDNELLRRITELESLVKNIEAPVKTEPAAAVRNPSQSSASTDHSTSFVDPPLTLDGDHTDPAFVYSRWIKAQENRKPPGVSALWTTLGDHVEGIRQLLENDESSDDDEPMTSPTSSCFESKASPPSFIFPGSEASAAKDVQFPTDSQWSILLQLYFDNVHPLVMVQHRPTAVRFFTSQKSLFSYGAFRFPSLQAVSYANFFAAVVSISDDECLEKLGEKKEILLARYKRGCEQALVKADFLNSMELVTLQAFCTYLIALRSCTQDRVSWSLIGLLVRNAHALGLHRDGDGTHLGDVRGGNDGHNHHFEAQMRRRLWWAIYILDGRAAEERGTEPMIAENSYNTHLPSNINDDDLSFAHQGPYMDRKGQTQMTFMLLCIEALVAARKINFVPLDDAPDDLRSPPTLLMKERILKQVSAKVESQYLISATPEEPMVSFNSCAWRLYNLKLWLAIQYPLQKRRGASSADYPRGQSLRTAVTYFYLLEILRRNELSRRFSWCYKSYVPWHALAATLTELCNHPSGELADQAWELVEKWYERWRERITDFKNCLLWKPVRTLYKRAKAIREQNQTGSANASSMPPMPIKMETTTTPEAQTSTASTIPFIPQVPVDPTAVPPPVPENTVTILPELPNLSLEDPMADPAAQAFDMPYNPSLLYEPNMGFLADADPSLNIPAGNMMEDSPATWDNWNDFVMDFGVTANFQDSNLDWIMQMLQGAEGGQGMG